MDTYRKAMPQPQPIENEEEFVMNSGRKLKKSPGNTDSEIFNERKTAVTGVSVLSSDDVQLLNADDLSDSLQAELHLSLERLSDNYEADDIKRLEETRRKNTELKQQIALSTEKTKDNLGIKDLFNRSVPETPNTHVSSTPNIQSNKQFQNLKDSLDQNLEAQYISTSAYSTNLEHDSLEDSDSEDATTVDSLESMRTPKNTETNYSDQKTMKETPVDKYASLRYNPQFVKNLNKPNSSPSTIPKLDTIDFKQAPRLPMSPMQQQLEDSLDGDNAERSSDRKDGAIIMHTRMPSSLTSVSVTRLSNDPDQLLKMNRTYEEEFAMMLEHERTRGKGSNSEQVLSKMTKKREIEKRKNAFWKNQQSDQCFSPQISRFWSNFDDEIPKEIQSNDVTRKANCESKNENIGQENSESTTDYISVKSAKNSTTHLNELVEKNNDVKSEVDEKTAYSSESGKVLNYEKEIQTMEDNQPQSNFENLHNNENSNYNEQINRSFETTPRLGGYIPLPARHMLTPTEQRPVAVSPRHQQLVSSPRYKNPLQALEPEVTPPGRRQRGIVPTPPRQPRGRSKDFVELNKQNKRKAKNTPNSTRPQSDLSGNIKQTEKNDRKNNNFDERRGENSFDSSNYHEEEFDENVTTENMWSKQASRLKQMRQPIPKRSNKFRQLGTHEQNSQEFRVDPSSILETYQPSIYMMNQQQFENMPKHRYRPNRRQIFSDSAIRGENGFQQNIDQNSNYQPSFAQGETPIYNDNQIMQNSGLSHVALPPDQSPPQQFTPRRRVTFNKEGVPLEMLQDHGSIPPSGNGARMLERNQISRHAMGKENHAVLQNVIQRENILPPLYKPSEKNEDRESLSPRKITESENGYASLHNKQNRKPWYKVYTLNDYKNLKRDVKLGGLGPDLESVKPKVDQVDRAKRYAEFVRQQHKTNKIVSDQPSFLNYVPGHHFSAVFDENMRQEQIEKRQKAIEYARRIPKPKIKQPPSNAQKTPVQATSPTFTEKNIITMGRNTKNISPNSNHSQDDKDLVDNYDIIQVLRERHEREKAQVSNFKQYA